ncbi:hypothetical protein A3715_18295 [Oleiphilus sp. HI0009]|nr:hypothetical protein A3715_18295 [Oleiphilus sp. HI0009]
MRFKPLNNNHNPGVDRAWVSECSDFSIVEYFKTSRTESEFKVYLRTVGLCIGDNLKSFQEATARINERQSKCQ